MAEDQSDATAEYANAVRRIVRAAEKGRGVRLSADDCFHMSLDMASWDCAINPTPAAHHPKEPK